MKWVSLNQSKPFIKGNNGGNTWMFVRGDTSSTLRAIFYRPGDIAIQTSSSGWADNTWHHVLIRVNTTTGDAQIIIDNNTEASSTSITGSLGSPTSYIQMMEPDCYFDEFIVTDDYDAPSDFADFSGATPCPITPAVPTIIHYRAEEVSTLSSILDQSGNGNDGEYFNGVYASVIQTDVPC